MKHFTGNLLTYFFRTLLGYQRALPEISHDPTSTEIRNRLDEWFESDARDSSDWVVLYYTGHGEIVGSDVLYLLTRDYLRGRPVTTSLPVSQISDMLIGRTASGENRRTKRFLLILDTCYSGAGALEWLEKIGHAFVSGLRGAMFYVLAAAFPVEEAFAGALGRALEESLADESLAGSQQEVLFMDQVIAAVNSRLPSPQRVVFCSASSPTTSVLPKQKVCERLASERDIVSNP